MRSLFLAIRQRLGLNAYMTGDYPRAERHFQAIARAEGESQRALRNLGLVRMALGDLAGAERLFARELELYGVTPSRLQALADAAYLSGDREKALRRVADALAHPDCPNRALLELRRRICIDAGAYGRAMKGHAHFQDGNALLATRDVQAALAAFQQAALADPSDFVALNNIGGIQLNHLNDPKAAARTFEQALALVDLPMLRQNLARARAALETAYTARPK
ncbi:MAG: tetratricopeptide repeat protein [Desulfovibrio aminophilus]|jgi:Flp pilus assembly protein TadD|uniref:tetratricopeptide repeat protein n=1 Tax=Desulfovibrio aminophilus TaxID=81425 RepID=UPI002A37C2DF|nr:tetratricopeptide repeat protein [Desulfovibrionaceae bacterium]